MTVKYKVLKDFQLITEDKKIIIIKAKTIIENYTFKNKNEIVKVPVDVIKNNADYFATFDWKEELQSFLRTNKIPQPAIITKKIVPFIESLMEDQETIIKEIVVEKEVVKEVIVEKPKIVEKEVVVEKPKIIEKEVIIEKTITDEVSQIEFESRVKKFELKEAKLENEIKENNKKEIELESKEKNLKELNDNLAQRQIQIEEKERLLSELESQLSEKHTLLSEKESNLSDYLSRSALNQRVSDLRSQGIALDIYDRLIQGL